MNVWRADCAISLLGSQEIRLCSGQQQQKMLIRTDFQFNLNLDSNEFPNVWEIISM